MPALFQFYLEGKSGTIFRWKINKITRKTGKLLETRKRKSLVINKKKTLII